MYYKWTTKAFVVHLLAPFHFVYFAPSNVSSLYGILQNMHTCWHEKVNGFVRCSRSSDVMLNTLSILTALQLVRITKCISNSSL